MVACARARASPRLLPAPRPWRRRPRELRLRDVDHARDDDAELQAPPDVAVADLRGQHWDIATHDGEYSAECGLGVIKEKFDHAFVRGPATARTGEFAFGSALGGWDDHPRADAGDGMDHRQLPFDLTFQP